jgi:hypothetical protein
VRKSQPTFGDKSAPSARTGRIDINVKTTCSSPPTICGWVCLPGHLTKKKPEAPKQTMFSTVSGATDREFRLRLSLNCGRSDFCWVCLFPV